jgi:hypothetical protein
MYTLFGRHLTLVETIEKRLKNGAFTIMRIDLSRLVMSTGKIPLKVNIWVYEKIL